VTKYATKSQGKKLKKEESSDDCKAVYAQ